MQSIISPPAISPNSHFALYTQSFVGIAALILIGLFLYGPSGHDDSHITYSAVQQLIQTGEILNTNGERVEQSSSLLHVLLLAAISTIIQSFTTVTSASILSIPSIGVITSLLCGALCIPLTLYLAQQLGIKQRGLLLVSLCSSVCFSYWAMGGLESTLVSLIFLSLVISLYQTLLFPSSINFMTLTFILLCAILSRPEIFAVIYCTLLAITTTLIAQVTALKRNFHDFTGSNNAHRYKRLFITLSIITLITTSLIMAVIAWRLSYFNVPFAQPVIAKSAGINFKHISFGLIYSLYSAQLSLFLLSLFIAITALFSLFRPLSALFCLRPITSNITPNTSSRNIELPLLYICIYSLSVSYISFIVISGGDWMQGGRFYTPILPLLLLALFHASHQCLSKRKARLTQLIVTTTIVIEACFFSQALSTAVPLYKHQKMPDALTASDYSFETYPWTETNNAVHVLDIIFIERLTPLINSIIALNSRNSKQVINIASIQMGMTPYYLRQTFEHNINFIDLRSLSTNYISNCPAFAKTPRVWTGIYVQHHTYIKASRNTALIQCNLPQPDIIYDLLNTGSKQARLTLHNLESLGYHIIWSQSGRITHGLELNQTRSRAFIAISAELYAMLAPTQPSLKDTEHTLFNVVY